MLILIRSKKQNRAENLTYKHRLTRQQAVFFVL